MSWGRKPRTPEICFLGPVAVLALLVAAAAVRCCAAEGTVAAVQSAPQPNPRGYASLDLSKGGVQSNLADLKPRAKIVIGGRTIDVAHLPAGLKHFADLGVIAPAWLDIRPLHRFPLPPLPPGEKGQGPADEPNAYADCPRPFLAPNGDMLVTRGAQSFRR